MAETQIILATAGRDLEITKREPLGFGFVRESYKETVPGVMILIIIDFNKTYLESNILTE